MWARSALSPSIRLTVYYTTSKVLPPFWLAHQTPKAAADSSATANCRLPCACARASASSLPPFLLCRVTTRAVVPGQLRFRAALTNACGRARPRREQTVARAMAVPVLPAGSVGKIKKHSSVPDHVIKSRLPVARPGVPLYRSRRTRREKGRKKEKKKVPCCFSHADPPVGLSEPPRWKRGTLPPPSTAQGEAHEMHCAQGLTCAS